MAATNPPRVLLVCPGFPVDEHDSICVPALQLFLRTARAQEQAEFAVVALDYPRARRRYQWHGIPVEAAGGNNVRGPARLVTWMRGAAAMLRLHRRYRPDLVHALWLTDAAALALSMKPLLRAPVVLTGMGRDTDGNTPWARVLPLRLATVVAPSQRAAQRLEATTGRSSDAVIPWGVEEPVGSCRAWQDRDVDVLGVGSLEPVKNWSGWLRIVADLIAVGRCRRAALIGDGAQRPMLEDLIRELGIGERVELLGQRPRSEALAWMARSRVLLHPARFEGLGLVMLEALAHGAMVVSRPVGIATESDSWLIADDEVELISATSAALATPHETRSLRPWTVEAVARSYGALYRTLWRNTVGGESKGPG